MWYFAAWDRGKNKKVTTVAFNIGMDPMWVEAWTPFRRRYFRCIFVNENICILIKISLNFVPKGPIDNNPALVQLMAPNRRQASIWTNADPIHWRIYAAVGGDEFQLRAVMVTLDISWSPIGLQLGSRK